MASTPSTPRPVPVPSSAGAPGPSKLPYCQSSPLQHSGSGADVRAHYDFKESIGKGTFAVVHRAVHRETGEVVAIKAVDKMLLDTNTRALLQNELETMRLVSLHPGVPTLHRSYDDKDHTMFVMDFVRGGPLLDQIVQQRTFTENDARATFHSALRTLNFMAKTGVVHRDIKPENLLVDELSTKWPVKISDFGFSAKIQTDELLYEAFGTPYYTAPEVIWRRGYSCACDVWSLGVVLYVVLFGFPPFAQTEHQALFRAIGRGKFDFPKDTPVSQDARDAVSKMLVVSPTDRITAAELLQHRWFTERPAASSPLPTDQLRTFNARRKVKGGFLGVTTTFHFWSMIGMPRRDAPNEQSKAADEKALKEVQDVLEPSSHVELRHTVPRVRTSASGALLLPQDDVPTALSRRSQRSVSAGSSSTTYQSSVGRLPAPIAGSSSSGGTLSHPLADATDTPASKADQASSTAWVPRKSSAAVAAAGVHRLSDLEHGADSGAWPPAPADTDSHASGASSVLADDVGDTLSVDNDRAARALPQQFAAGKKPHRTRGPDGDSGDSDDSFKSLRDVDADVPPPVAPPGTDSVAGEDSPQSVMSRRRSLLLGEVPAGSPPHPEVAPTELDEELRNLLHQAESDGVDDATCNPFFASSTSKDADREADVADSADDDAVVSAPLRRLRVADLSGIRNVGNHARSVSLPATPHVPAEASAMAGVKPPQRDAHGVISRHEVAVAPPVDTPLQAQSPPAAPASPPGGLGQLGTHSRSDILNVVRSEVQAVSATPEDTVMPPLPPPRRRRRLAPLDLRNIS
ncbi:hypothetical protein MMPV_009317 [Pyropia vietnamensis]